MKKTKTFSRVCALLMALLLTLQCSPVTTAYAAADHGTNASANAELVSEPTPGTGEETAPDDNYVVFAVERFTIGQGFFVEPVRVPLQPDDTVYDIIHRIVGDNAIVKGGNYLSGIKTADLGPDHVKVPDYITNMDENAPTTQSVIEYYNENAKKDGALSEKVYHPMSGWYYQVNSQAPGFGIGSYTLEKGDVIRIQHTLYGFGADVTGTFYGGPTFAEMQNNDALYKVMAEINDSPAELRNNASIKSLYAKAVQLSEAMIAPQQEVDALVTTLSDTVAKVKAELNKPFPQPEPEPEPDPEPAPNPSPDPTPDQKPEFDSATMDAALTKALDYMASVTTNPAVGSINGEWTVLVLARNNRLSDTVKETYLKNLQAKLVETNGVLSSRKYTEYSRVILGMSSLNMDPAQAYGYNLIEPLKDFKKVCRQGINGPVWALIALDSGNYPMDGANGTSSRDMMIDYILKDQLPGGGWGLGSKPDDMTPMAIQALAPYCDRPEVKAAVDAALSVLSQIQDEDGGFGLAGGSESISQVVIALAALDKDLFTDARFIKNGHTMMDALLRYQTEEGAFRHLLTGKADAMATDQATLALTAYQRAMTGKTFLYDMTDLKDQNPDVGPEVNPDEKPAPTPDVKPNENTDSKPETKPEEAPAENPEAKPEVKPESKPEKDPNRKPLQSGKPVTAGKSSGKSNMVDAKAANGVVPMADFASVQGQDKVLRMTGTLPDGSSYTMMINGKDVVEPMDTDISLTSGSSYEEDIRQLAENPYLFHLKHSGAFPGPMYLELNTGLEDGEYLLLQYDIANRKALLVQKVKIGDGLLQCVLEQGGDYFLAKKASAAPLTAPEQEADTVVAEQPVSSTPEQDQTSGTPVYVIWIGVVLGAAACGGIGFAIGNAHGKKKKEH